MALMVENEDGKMEFPQGIMLEECFMDMEEATFGFATNVTLLNESACVLDVECTINGTSIRRDDATLSNTTYGDAELGILNATLAEHDLRNDLTDELITSGGDLESRKKARLFINTSLIYPI